MPSDPHAVNGKNKEKKRKKKERISGLTRRRQPWSYAIDVHGNDILVVAVAGALKRRERRRENGNMQFVLRQVGAAPRVALQAQRSMYPPPSCLAAVHVHVHVESAS